MRTIECKQGSEEWWNARRGVPSASNFSRIITPKTGAMSKSIWPYIAELIADRLTEYDPESMGSYASKPMFDGVMNEPAARAWYEFEHDVEVRQVGFCVTDDGRFGCSPDGLVGDDGGLELKCPMLKTQIGYLLHGGLPDEYKAQVHGSLAVTGRKWWDFVSYCWDAPPLVVRVEPDEYTAALRDALDEFWPLYDQAWRSIQAMDAPIDPVLASRHPDADVMF